MQSATIAVTCRTDDVPHCRVLVEGVAQDRDRFFSPIRWQLLNHVQVVAPMLPTHS
jgi:hypothetical protein